MAKKKGSREMPEMNTSSLPDLIFTILFFFMIVTTMREVTLKVKFVVPAGTELEKLEKKSAVSFVYVGPPTDQLRAQFGSSTRIQLNDRYALCAPGASVDVRPECSGYLHQGRPEDSDGLHHGHQGSTA